MKVLVTGAAGFIGSALSLQLLKRGDVVVGIDNHNDYYDPLLKEARLKRHKNHENYLHYRVDLEDSKKIKQIFKEHSFDAVVNLAAQAGVRYSIKNPLAYINSNLLGFANIIEGCRHAEVAHLLYASSSSVYGLNTKLPLATSNSTNHPVSLYAATKKANELMAHSYSHLYGLPTTGLRFFTVYGPFDRPDMALQKFASAIVNDETIKIYNYGKHKRDFTYIDDVICGLLKVLQKPATPYSKWNSNNPNPAFSSAPYRIFNIGNNKPAKLMDYIGELESSLGKEARKEFLPLQPGDVLDTYADINDLENQFDFKPKTTIKEGIKNFVMWYKKYNKLDI